MNKESGYRLRYKVIKLLANDGGYTDVMHIDDQGRRCHSFIETHIAERLFAEGSEREGFDEGIRQQVDKLLMSFASDCYVIGWANGKGEPAGQDLDTCRNRALEVLERIIYRKDEK